MSKNSDDSEKPSLVACRSQPGLTGGEIATHGFSDDMVLRSALDTFVCANIAGMEMQEDA